MVNILSKDIVESLLLNLESLDIPIKGAKVGVLGISRKANYPDIQKSSSFNLISRLKELDLDVFTYDPHCPDESNSELKEIFNECVGIIITIGRDKFLKINNWENTRFIIDKKNCLNRKKLEKKGITYENFVKRTKKVNQRPRKDNGIVIFSIIKKPVFYKIPKLIKNWMM